MFWGLIDLDSLGAPTVFLLLWLHINVIGIGVLFVVCRCWMRVGFVMQFRTHGGLLHSELVSSVSVQLWR